MIMPDNRSLPGASDAFSIKIRNYKITQFAQDSINKELLK